MRNMRILFFCWFLLATLLSAACNLRDPLVDEHGQIPPGMVLPGTYRGEFRFFANSTSPLFFSRTQATISEEGDLSLDIVDSVMLHFANTEVYADSIVGILTSEGEFWGKIFVNHDSAFALLATSIPDTLLDDALMIRFMSSAPIADEGIDSISCVLHKN